MHLTEVSKMAKLNPLRLARLENELTQWDVAKQTGISQSLISLYEKEVLEPKEEHRQALAKLYGREMKDL
jgi:transcriptional regulator with XRE-family HTH domain